MKRPALVAALLLAEPLWRRLPRRGRPQTARGRPRLRPPINFQCSRRPSIWSVSTSTSSTARPARRYPAVQSIRETRCAIRRYERVSTLLSSNRPVDGYRLVGQLSGQRSAKLRFQMEKGMPIPTILVDPTPCKVERVPFASESSLHRFTEENCERLLGLALLASARRGGEGVFKIDVLAADRDGRLWIIECKHDLVDSTALRQVRKYQARLDDEHRNKTRSMGQSQSTPLLRNPPRISRVR